MYLYNIEKICDCIYYIESLECKSFKCPLEKLYKLTTICIILVLNAILKSIGRKNNTFKIPYNS